MKRARRPFAEGTSFSSSRSSLFLMPRHPLPRPRRSSYAELSSLHSRWNLYWPSFLGSPLPRWCRFEFLSGAGMKNLNRCYRCHCLVPFCSKCWCCLVLIACHYPPRQTKLSVGGWCAFGYRMSLSLIPLYRRWATPAFGVYLAPSRRDTMTFFLFITFTWIFKLEYQINITKVKKSF